MGLSPKAFALICTAVIFVIGSLLTQVINVYIIFVVYVAVYQAYVRNLKGESWLAGGVPVFFMVLLSLIPWLLIRFVYFRLTGVDLDATLLRPHFLKELLHWQSVYPYQLK